MCYNRAMKKRQEIINQIVFILIVLFIIFLLWGYGAGWLGASADVVGTDQKTGIAAGVSSGIKKLWQKPYFEQERDWNLAL